MNVNPNRLEDQKDNEQTLESHNVWWHEACNNRFDSLQLSRAKQCKVSEMESSSPVKTQNSIGTQSLSTRNCVFFCNAVLGIGLHIASTTEADSHVCQAAKTLQERALLAK